MIADRAIPYDPYMVKETISYGLGRNETIRDHYFSKPEQLELARNHFDNLRSLEFLASRTIDEGAPPLPLEPFSLRPFGIRPPDRRCVLDVKRRLVLRDGRKVKDVLADIATASLASPMAGAAHGEHHDGEDALETDL
jgi:hypothetical protein